MADGNDHAFGEGVSPLGDGPSPQELAKYELNDFGNAMRLIRLAGGRIDKDGEVHVGATTLLYLRDAGWIGFNGRFWDLRGGEGLAKRVAAKVHKGMWAQAAILAEQMRADGASKKEVDSVYDFAESCGNSGRMDAMLKVARTYLEVDLDAFDRDPLALNVRNGTIKFRRVRDERGRVTGVTRTFLDRHDPADRITRMAEVDYDPASAAPLFLASLATWQPEIAMRRYLQTALGYGVTGYTGEQAFFIFQGLGRDGKSTLMNLMRKLMGSYAVKVDVATFLDQGPRRGGDASPDVARLAGDTRLISTAEPPRNAKLADDRIKDFTGGGNITTRRLRQDIFEFAPKGKVFLECNARPQPQGLDEGIFRRLKLAMFEHQIPKGKEDKELPDKLELERPGVLNWLLEGVEIWLREGLVEPRRVTEAVEDYRKGSNPFAEWFDDRLVIDKSARVPASDLYKAYKAWMEEMGHEKPMSQTTFGKALAERQIILAGKDRRGNKLRSGARLKTDAEILADNAAEDELGAGGRSGGEADGSLSLPPEDDDLDAFDPGNGQ